MGSQDPSALLVAIRSKAEPGGGKVVQQSGKEVTRLIRGDVGRRRCEQLFRIHLREPLRVGSEAAERDDAAVLGSSARSAPPSMAERM